MTDQITRWLNESQRLADQATEGPWEACRQRLRLSVQSVKSLGSGGVVAHTGYGEDDERAGLDARFIAEARARLPQAVAALKAIMELHRPVEVDPSETVCPACSHLRGWGESVRYSPAVEHPCGTRQLVEAALGLEGDDDAD